VKTIITFLTSDAFGFVLKLVSGISTAIFALYGIGVKTREDNDGPLTKAGKIALTGVLVSAAIGGASASYDFYSGQSKQEAERQTHLHGDHVGYLPPDGPLSSDGTYRLTGVSDVAAIVPIQRFVDRAWPDYTYPVPADIDFQKNYRAFLQAQIKTGKRVERFRPGSKDQFALQHKSADYPSFEIRNLIANGEVWTGKGEQTRKLFPEVSTLKPADYPAENPCSCAIRLRYGKFGYYTGGDLTNDTNYGRDPWHDSESPAAEVCGPVSAAVANHHGYFNANGDRYVRALQPQVFVIPTWDSAHPTVNVLNALYSKAIYSGNRDVFATSVKQENRIANKKTDDLKSRAGHIVIRVEPGGETFAVHILSNADESDTVTASFGPYTS
jgi:hypothetical protein